MDTIRYELKMDALHHASCKHFVVETKMVHDTFTWLWTQNAVKGADSEILLSQRDKRRSRVQTISFARFEWTMYYSHHPAHGSLLIERTTETWRWPPRRRFDGSMYWFDIIHVHCSIIPSLQLIRYIMIMTVSDSSSMNHPFFSNENEYCIGEPSILFRSEWMNGSYHHDSLD